MANVPTHSDELVNPVSSVLPSVDSDLLKALNGFSRDQLEIAHEQAAALDELRLEFAKLRAVVSFVVASDATALDNNPLYWDVIDLQKQIISHLIADPTLASKVMVSLQGFDGWSTLNQKLILLEKERKQAAAVSAYLEDVSDDAGFRGVADTGTGIEDVAEDIDYIVDDVETDVDIHGDGDEMGMGKVGDDGFIKEEPL